MLSVVVFGDKRKDSWVITGLISPTLAERVKDILGEQTGRDVYVFDAYTPPGSQVMLSHPLDMMAEDIVNGWLQSGAMCGHDWIAGIVYVDDEDLATVAATRQVSCNGCGLVYDPRLA